MSTRDVSGKSSALRISCSTTELCRHSGLRGTPKDPPATPVATPEAIKRAGHTALANRVNYSVLGDAFELNAGGAQ